MHKENMQALTYIKVFFESLVEISVAVLFTYVGAKRIQKKEVKKSNV
jgi:hypothetical protein